METLSEYVLEPEAARPPPRPVRHRPGAIGLMLIAGLVFAVFAYGGLRALGEAGRLAWIAAMGHSVTARVASIDYAPSPFKGSSPVPVSLRYQYRLPQDLPGTVRVGRALLDATGAANPAAFPGRRGAVGTTRAEHAPRVGDALPLRWLAWRGRTVVMPWPVHPWGQIVFLALCGGLIVGISALLLWRLGRRLQERGHLLRRGQAAVGTILHKRTEAHDVPRYFVTYGYARQGPGAVSEMREHEEQVTLEQWRRWEIGQPVTVLYDPAHADEAGLYALLRGG